MFIPRSSGEHEPNPPSSIRQLAQGEVKARRAQRGFLLGQPLLRINENET